MTKRPFGWRPACLVAGIAMLFAVEVAHAAPPTVASITFAPTPIKTGSTSRLTITLANGNTGPATLLQPLTDTLPAGLTVMNPSGLGGTCGAGVGAGTNTLTYAAGAVVPPGGCTIQVNVTGTSTVRDTYYTDTIAAGALATDLGSSPTTVNGTLVVQAAVTVPNVVGLSPTAAAAVLQAAGLVVGTITKGAAPGSAPFNSVASQAPGAGATVAAGTAVSIKVSTGAGLATNNNQPLTSVPGYVQPYQQSEAVALERVCAALQGSDPSSLSTGQRNMLANCNAILGTYGGGGNASGLKGALDALSGKQTTAQQRTGVQFAGAQFTNIGARLAQLRQGLYGSSLAGLDWGAPSGNGAGTLLAAIADAVGIDPSGQPRGGGAGDADSISASTRWGFYLNGSLRRGNQDTTTYETPFDFKANTLTAGVDYRLTDRVVLGLALGHSNGSTVFSDGSGRLDARSNSASLYGTYYHRDFYVDVIGSLAHVTYKAARTTSYGIDSSITPTPASCTGTTCLVDTSGSTGGQQLGASSNVGYSFNAGGLVWGPDVSIDYTRIRVNAFSETDLGQSGLGLDFASDIGESLLAKAGGHLSYAVKLPFGVLLPEARAHYIHEFKNDQQALSVHFSSDPDTNAPTGPLGNFVVFTDAPQRNYFDWAAGVSAQFAFGISAFADYNAIQSSIQRVHEFALGVRIEHQVR